MNNKIDEEEYFTQFTQYCSESKLREALIKLARAISQNPNDFELYNSYGSTLADLCQYQQSLKMYAKAIKLENKESHVWFNLACSLERLYQYEDAIVSYEKAAELDKRDPDIFLNWGNILFIQNKVTEAIKKFEHAISIRPFYCKAYNNLGWIYYCQDLYEEAIQNYKRAIDINPNYIFPYFNWGLVILHQNNLDMAKEMWMKGLKSITDKVSELKHIAFIYENLLSQAEKQISDPLNEGMKDHLEIRINGIKQILDLFRMENLDKALKNDGDDTKLKEEPKFISNLFKTN